MRHTQHFICNVGGWTGGGQVKLADGHSTVIDIAIRLSREIIYITLPQSSYVSHFSYGEFQWDKIEVLKNSGC
jgi:hypothetical protein